MKTKLVAARFLQQARTSVLLFSLTGIFAGSFTGLAASPSDLLEKAIYSEQTKGDIDEAMTLYKQVVAESKSGEAAAAQAQYRLGVCYYRKKDYGAASAAFEKLVREYPDQKELVKAAQEYLDGALLLAPAPWADGEQQTLDLKLASGFKVGVAIYTVDSGETNGQKIWRFGSHLNVGFDQLSHVEAQADNLKPIHSRWKHPLLGDADTTYSPGQAVVKFAGKDEPKKVELEGTVYDNEEAVQAMRRLPLSTNYSVPLRIFSSLGGGTIVPITASVEGIDKVTVPAGTFDCFKVNLSLVKQSFWYSIDSHRYVVKFEGGGVVAELSSVKTRDPNAPVQFNDAGVSLSAPPGWLFYKAEVKQSKNKTRVAVLDPDGLTTCTLTLQTLDSMPAESKKSLRALADSIIEERKIELGLTVRTNSWRDLTVAGLPALSFVCDYAEGKEDKVGYGICSLGTANAIAFSALLPAKDFEAFRPKFDAIVDSYKNE